MKITIADAVLSLRPKAQFYYSNDDYSTIKFDILEGNQPTKKQVDDEIKRLEALAIVEAENKTIAKAALLERLGITEDEAKLLLS